MNCGDDAQTIQKGMMAMAGVTAAAVDSVENPARTATAVNQAYNTVGDRRPDADPSWTLAVQAEPVQHPAVGRLSVK